MLVPFAVAVTVPVHVPRTFGTAATFRSVGSVSTIAELSVSATGFWFPSVIVSVTAVPVATDGDANDFATVGLSRTVSVAVASTALFPESVFSVPATIVFVNTPSTDVAADVTGTVIVQLLLAAIFEVFLYVIVWPPSATVTFPDPQVPPTVAGVPSLSCEGSVSTMSEVSAIS